MQMDILAKQKSGDIIKSCQGKLRFILTAVCLSIAMLMSPASHGNAPSGRFKADSATVTDAKTTLVWQRIVSPTTYTWTDAQAYCVNNAPALPGTGWRLPMIKELQTLVDDRMTDPAVDPIFAPSSSGIFWSATLSANAPTDAWVVSFFDGINGHFEMSLAQSVRCVR